MLDSSVLLYLHPNHGWRHSVLYELSGSKWQLGSSIEAKAANRVASHVCTEALMDKGVDAALSGAQEAMCFDGIQVFVRQKHLISQMRSEGENI